MRTHRVAVAFAFPLLADAVTAQYFEARNMAMGRTGVASSHYLAAGWANPALLATGRDGDDFGLILPTVGAIAYDETQLIDDVEAFVDEFNRLDSNPSATPQDYVNLAAQLQDLSGRPADANLGVGFMLARPSRTDLAWSLHVHSYSDLQAVMEIDPADVIAIGATTPGNPLPALNSEARVLGAAITEVGLSVAKRFDLSGIGLLIGATPKYQRVDTYNYAVTVDNFDQNDFDDSQYRNDDSAFNLDLGAALQPGAGLTFGLIARDLIRQDYDTETTQGQRFSYRIEPGLSLGGAWSLSGLTVAADIDLIARERFEDQTLALTSLRLDDDVQTAHLGAEIDLAHWLQLRGGVELDLQDTLDNAYTAGVGLSPFDVFKLDVAGIYVAENSYGAVVQMAFTF